MDIVWIRSWSKKRSMDKLVKEKAIYYSQTKRSMNDNSGINKKWRAIRADNTTVRPANMFKF